MENTKYVSYEELPLLLNVKMLANVMSISLSTAYELTRADGFPTVHVGKRIVVPKDRLKQWVEENTCCIK